MKTISIIAALLLITGSLGSLFFYHSALTAVVNPVVSTLDEPGKEKGPHILPLYQKANTIPENDMDDKAYVMHDFEASSEKFPIYWGASAIWIIGMGLLLFRYGVQRNDYHKPLFVIGASISFMAITFLFRGSAAAIMAFDTMGISGGADPGSLGLDIGYALSSVKIGWIMATGATVLFVIGISISKKEVETRPSLSKKVLSYIGIGIIATSVGVLIWNLTSYGKIQQIEPFLSDPSAVASMISAFMISQTSSFLLLFIASVFAITAFALGRKKIPAS